MAMRLPPLSGLRLFEAAARCGSFKRAAQELSLTPGALSHGIDSLEQWLDVELFERKGHGVVLTTIVVDRAVPVRSGYWLLRPPGNETRREIIAFRNWLLEEMAQLKWSDHEAEAEHSAIAALSRSA
jgi:DNA-binding transcriptional LysR family regulator